MAQIILQILAVLGIILLCLLGLCLALLLFILFVPVRYRLSGQKSGEEIKGKVGLSWLLHLVTVSYRHPEPGEVILRVAGIRVWSLKVSALRKGEADAEAKADKSQEGAGLPKGAGDTNAPHPAEKTAKTTGTSDTENTENAADTANGADTADAAEDGRKRRHRASLTERIGKIRRRLCHIWDKVKEILENIEYYRDLLLQKENRLLYGRCWKQVRRILYHIRPRTIKADLIVGTGAPDTTGYLLALYGMMLPFLGNHINIVPDFNEPVLEGKLFLKGRIALFTLLRGGIRILLDKQLHQLMGKLKREEK